MTISDDEREWIIQESRFKAQTDYETGMNCAHAKGVEEGMTAAARGMKAENIPVETIIKITGLTPEQVASL